MKNFKKYYRIPAAPDEVYRALTNPLSIRLWTGEGASMEPVAGTEFSIFDDAIVGRNLEFEENKKIVQEWYFEEEEPKSIVSIKLHANPEGTSLELRHDNIPDEEYEQIVNGWEEIYIPALVDFF